MSFRYIVLIQSGDWTHSRYKSDSLNSDRLIRTLVCYDCLFVSDAIQLLIMGTDVHLWNKENPEFFVDTREQNEENKQTQNVITEVS